MWMPDVNVLLGAVLSQQPQHSVAREALETAYAQEGPVAFTWVVLTGFIRITTRRGAMDPPMDVQTALRHVDDWLAHPRATVLHPGSRHGAILSRLLLGAGRAGNLTTDAHLAAIAIEHGATLVSFDRDFESFPGLRFRHLKASVS